MNVSEEKGLDDDERRPLAAAAGKDDKRKLTPLAKLVIFILLTTLFFFISGLIIALSYEITFCRYQFKPPAGGHSSVCLTAGCIQLAATVSKKMDTSIDPCTDFYNYSCGGWDKANIIPAGKGAWGVFQVLNKNNNIAIKKLLDGAEESDIEATQLLREVYRSCMDTNNLTMQGAAPLLKLLNETGGWDLIGLHNDSAPAWNTSSHNFRWSQFLGNSGFLAFFVGINNNAQHVSILSQSGLSFHSRSSYTDEKHVNKTIPALRKYISSILKLLGPDGNYHEYLSAADQIIEFEKDLVKIFVSKPNLHYHLTLSELSNGTYWRQFNWTEFVVETYKLAGVDDIPSNLTIAVITPSYFVGLSDVFAKYNKTVLENYYKWHLVKNYVSKLGNDFLTVYYEYTTAVYGTSKKERCLTCISAITKIVPMSISRLYTDYVLPPGTRGNISEIVDQIKLAFIKRLKMSSFLDNVTKQKLIWKVSNISKMVAYPDNITDNHFLLSESKPVIKGGRDYFETTKWDTILGSYKNLRKLKERVNQKEWHIPPTYVNAYYGEDNNQFGKLVLSSLKKLHSNQVFLEGILNPPFFQSDWPEYFKYGAFGLVAGHELTHGFEDQGQMYNQYEWTDQSVKAFREKKTCFVNQYSKYSIFGYYLNGSFTQDENIADNVGLKTAYQAYKQATAGTIPQTLPSLDLQPDQLFFIAYAQVWCSIFSPNFIATNLKVNPHSPGPYRVIGAVSNSKEFSDAFHCPSNSLMNPPNKCELW